MQYFIEQRKTNSGTGWLQWLWCGRMQKGSQVYLGLSFLRCRMPPVFEIQKHLLLLPQQPNLSTCYLALQRKSVYGSVEYLKQQDVGHRLWFQFMLTIKARSKYPGRTPVVLALSTYKERLTYHVSSCLKTSFSWFQFLHSTWSQKSI